MRVNESLTLKEMQRTKSNTKKKIQEKLTMIKLINKTG